MPDEQTIAAIATAISPGQGGIAVIRISGLLAEKASKSILYLPGEQIWKSHLKNPQEYTKNLPKRLPNQKKANRKLQ